MSESVEVVRQKEIVKRMRELNSKVIAERDALAAELADMTADRDHWQRECNKATARIAELEAALKQIHNMSDATQRIRTLAYDAVKMATSERETK